MKNILKSSILSLLFLFPALLKAQEIEMANVPLQFEGDLISILDMEQDEKGFIWMADNGTGLYKYDGSHLINFRPEPGNPNSIISGRLEHLEISKSGIVWIATFDQGLERFDPETEIFTHFQNDANDQRTIRSNAIRTIVEDTDGNLWIGTNSGIDKFDVKTNEFTHISGDSPAAQALNEEHVRSMYLDQNNILWIGTGSAFLGEQTEGGLFSYNTKTGEVIRYLHSEQGNSLINNHVRAIFEDSKGTFWVGTSGDGLHTMDREKGTFVRHQYNPENPHQLSRPPILNSFNAADDHITFITEDNIGIIWIGTFEGGLTSYNPSTQKANHYGTNQKGSYYLPRNGFWSSLRTNDGLLWITEWITNQNESLILKINNTPARLDFTAINAEVYSFEVGEEGSIYLGTKNGIMQMDTNGKMEKLFELSGIGNDTRKHTAYIEKDAFGNLWISSFRGLYYYNPNTQIKKIYRHDAKNKNSIVSDTVYMTHLIDADRLLIATQKGLSVLNLKDESFTNYIHDASNAKSISGNEVKSIEIDHNGNIWVGTFLNGINKFDLSTEEFKYYSFGIGLHIVNDIHEDDQQNLWIITTNHGLRLYDEELDQFKSFVDNTGILSRYQTMTSIIHDDQNDLWLDTWGELVHLDLKDSSALVYDDNWNVERNADFDIRPKLFKSSEGEIYYASIAGYYHFKPSELQQKYNAIPEPFLNKLFIDNKVIIPKKDALLPESLINTQQISLTHDQNDLSFELGNIDFLSLSLNNSVQYQLENYDTEWRVGDGGDLIAYYKIPPGEYSFKIKTKNLFGNWGEASLEIYIAEPWYQTWWAYLIYVFLVVGILRAYILYKARSLKLKNKLLEDEVENRTAELKASQSQLIQSEKMASLGELTAGIAHEIQNPLNFVNNFSDVSGELVHELKEELDKGDIKEAKIISDDVIQNLEKINHHGNRASSIVNGMLEHSRTRKGEKVPTDINALADEYLRLAYHGLRAKDKSFNADFKTDFDEKLPKVNVISQDIGRVILNLINNSFQAVTERSGWHSGRSAAKVDNFKPLVTISTKLSANRQLLIAIKDNGPGIPPEIKDKIFQPFFTTKPTGKGTGLGLSLAYDIVKAHGGEINVKSEISIGTTFVIMLPIG